MAAANFWQLFAGLGIFLFGIFQMESALKQLGGRTFKLFLRKHTDNKYNAVFSGTLVTALLQSSSVVSLMVLSFVGAGVLTMRNALAVIFGSNLGSTTTSWVVASLGFKVDIESFALPIIAIAGAGLIIFPSRRRFYHASVLLIGFGLMFLGLSFMKVSIESLITNFDFSTYIHRNRLNFVLIGFIITALIQSSSATMVITLSALNTGVIPFEAAASVIIGSELGTSIKTLLGSLGGIAAKRRVALGNIIFNIFITIFAYLLTYPLIGLIRNVVGVDDPLIGLALFQTLINFAGIICFLPFLNNFSRFLEKHIAEKTKTASYFIQNVDPETPGIAVERMEKETLLFIHRVIHLNMEAFRIDEEIAVDDNGYNEIITKINAQLSSYYDKYDHVKRAEGEILSLYTKISKETKKEDFVRLERLMSSVRNAIYSAKGIKDIRRDKTDMRESAVDVHYQQYTFLQSQLRDFYARLRQILKMEDKTFCFEELVRLMEQIRNDYDVRMKDIYKHSASNAINEKDISTLLNVNREIFSSCKALIFSVKDYLLDANEAEDFENVPVSILK